MKDARVEVYGKTVVLHFYSVSIYLDVDESEILASTLRNAAKVAFANGNEAGEVTE